MRIKELDGLRGIAVLAVMTEHYLSWIPGSSLRYGWLGVDLFFVLSGFLITSILLDLRNQERYFGVFYARRALRIFPPYFLGLLAYLGFSIEQGKPGSWSLWLRYIFYYSSLLPNQPQEVIAVPPVLPVAAVLGLAVLWSLSVEEVYYTIWAPVVRWTSHRGFVSLLVGMILLAPLLRWWMHGPVYHELLTFYCRMDGLAYGSAVALLIHDRRKNPEKRLGVEAWIDRLGLVLLPATAVFWLATHGDRTSVLVDTVGIVMADLSFAVVVHALVRRADGDQIWVRMFRTRWLRSVGMVSYSLYLFHYPLRYLAVQIAERLHLAGRTEAVAGTFLGLILSFGVAYGLWYGMESRILRWKDRRVPSPAHPGS